MAQNDKDKVTQQLVDGKKEILGFVNVTEVSRTERFLIKLQKVSELICWLKK